MASAVIPDSKSNPLAIIYNENSKLPNPVIYDLMLDKAGFIWLATEKGIFRFDGQNFKSYRSNLQNSLSGSSLKQDLKGRIWYENFDGFVFYVANDSLHTIPNQNPNAYLPIGLSKNKIFLYQQNKIISYHIASLDPADTLVITNNSISDIDYTSDELILADYGKIVFIDGDRLHIKKQFNTPFAKTPLRIHQGESSLFLAQKNNESGFIYEYKRNELIPIKVSFKIGLINKIKQIKNKLYLLTTNGIYVFHKENNKWVERHHWFAGISILSMLQDEAGSVWLGTNGEGLIKIPDSEKKLEAFGSNQEIVKIIRTPTGFIGSGRNGQVFSLNKNLQITKQIYQDPDSLPFISFYHDSVNNLLFLSSKLSVVFDLQKRKIIRTDFFSLKDACLIDKNIYLMAISGSAILLNLTPVNQTPNSTVWKKFKGDKNSSKIGSYKEILLDIRARSVAAFPAQNILFIATNKGLFKQTPTQSIEIKNKQQSLYIQTIVSNGQTLWGLSTKGELFRFEPKAHSDEFTLTTINRKHPINHIKLDAKGIIIFDPYSCTLLDFNTLEEIGKINVQAYALKQRDAIVIDDELVLLTDKGWIKKKLGLYEPNRKSWFKVYEVSNDLQSFEPSTSFSILYSKNELDIRFLWFPSLSETGENIAYRINNSGWNTLENEARLLHLEALSPGDYEITFKTGDTIWDKQSVLFTVPKPYYAQTWFIGIIIISLVSLFIWFYKQRLQKIEEKNNIITERLTLEKELNHSRLSSIRAQMNPHFFYNALNTIQAFIFQKDQENAIEYLNKFSKLTRMILDVSDKETINLESELESLQLYLELEKMRFSDQFDYQLNFNFPNKDAIQIPSMIIQPYVENAIKHGLMHLKTGRKLSINIIEKMDYLEVIVDDNGIGRKRSGELNTIRQNMHKSFSTVATEKRLNILNRGLNNKVLVSYLDKENAAGAALGTQVTILIPIR